MGDIVVIEGDFLPARASSRGIDAQAIACIVTMWIDSG
jgi:hypothetical protein